MVQNVFITIVALLLMLDVGNTRQSDLNVDIRMLDQFTQEELSDMLIAVVEQSGNSPYFQITAENTSNGIVRNGSLIFEIRSEQFGNILTAEQTPSGRFSLNPDGEINFSNLTVSNVSNLEIEGEPEFDLVVSSNGRKLIQNLRRGYLLTDDVYTLHVKIVQNLRGEQQELSEATASFETSLDESELAIDVDLIALNELMGLNVTKEAPEFLWQGEQNRSYRLIILDADRAQNRDELFAERFEREHSDQDIRDEESGVVLDVISNEPGYQIPDQYASLFEPGRTYAWQVQTSMQTVQDDIIQVFSERFEFTTSFPIEGEIRDLLIAIFGEEKTEEFIEEGLLFDQIQIDGETYSKAEALTVLREMAEKIGRNQLKVIS